MATTSVKRLFVDTNILIFATSKDAPFQPVAESELHAWISQRTELYVSTQVLREYLAVTTRLAAGVGAEPDYDSIAANLVEFRRAFQLLEDTVATSKKLQDLVLQFSVKGKQVHDTNIVSVMLLHGISDLLTHNPDEFKRYSGLIRTHSLSSASGTP
jgi:predicted nucleic acid-binding protein